MGLTDLETIPETGAVFTIGRSRFADNVASHFFIRKDPVVSIACGDEHSAVICQSGRLFVFGSNGWGQLGLGHKTHVSKPSCVKILKPEKVTHVACGRAHTLICTGGQKIFACGSDQEGQLGRGSSAIGDSASSPVRVYDCGLAGPRVLEIAAGSHHSLALTSDGGVVAWGSNLEGQLGLSGVSGLVNKPTKVPIPEPVKHISAGYYHSAFLTESGLIYVCGESESGKLGIDVNFSTQVAPKQMQLPSPAVQVSCGGHHTFILAENGNLYCTGSNSSGQLGLGTNVTEIQTPKLLPRGALQNETIARIACGESHSAVVTESGKLFTCGDGRHGKLGLEENENNVQELTLAPKYQDLYVSNVACGGCHTILVAHRRESRNGQAQGESESVQMDHIQKRNSLPPLKLPVSRLQSETIGETTNEKEKPDSDEEKDRASTTPVENIAKIKEDIPDDTIASTEHGIAETTKEKKDSMNNIKDIESSEKLLHEASEEASSASAKDKEATMVNGTKEEKNDNEKSETEVDSENNIQEEKLKTDDTKNEDHNKAPNASDSNENHTENNIETSNERDEKTSQENDKDNTIENNINKENNEDDRVNATTKEAEPTVDAEKEKSTEKRASSLNSPPPKPPRLKPSSAGSSSPGRVSSAKTEKENASVEDNTKEQNPDVAKSARSTRAESNGGDSKSTKSIDRDGTEDTIEIDKGKDEADGKEKSNEEEKLVTDGAPDDADVVQSPAPRTGKMSKIFKAKKQQEMENGTKAVGTANHKAKSKTCTLL